MSEVAFLGAFGNLVRPALIIAQNGHVYLPVEVSVS